MSRHTRAQRPPIDPDLVVRCTGEGPDAERAKELVCEHFRPVIDEMARGIFFESEQQREDGCHNAVIALLIAAKKFDPTGSVPFDVIARRRMRDAMIDTVRPSKSAAAFTVVPLAPYDRASNTWTCEEYQDGEWASGSDSVEQESELRAVHMFVAGLPAIQQSIVRDVFWNDLNQAEVARRRGTSRAAVTKTLERVYRDGRVVLADLSPRPGQALIPAA